MKFEFDRPFLDFEKQISKLKSDYNLSITNDEQAIELLSSISYYDLINGYKETVAIDEDFNGSSIEDLYFLNYIDKSIQNILFKYSVYVENRFKTILSYCISANYGVDVKDYLDENLYFTKDSKNTVNNILKSINRNHLTNPTKYYKKNHNHIPPWILFKNISFNDSIDLFLGLDRIVQNDICSLLLSNKLNKNKSLKFVRNGLIIVRKFRNIIAHNLKFITFKSKEEITLKDLSTIYTGTLIESFDFMESIGKNDIYAMILSLMTLLNVRSLQINFCYDLYREIKRFKNQDINTNRLLNLFLNITKIPNNIDDRLFKEITKK